MNKKLVPKTRNYEMDEGCCITTYSYTLPDQANVNEVILDGLERHHGLTESIATSNVLRNTKDLTKLELRKTLSIWCTNRKLSEDLQKYEANGYKARLISDLDDDFYSVVISFHSENNLVLVIIDPD